MAVFLFEPCIVVRSFANAEDARTSSAGRTLQALWWVGARGNSYEAHTLVGFEASDSFTYTLVYKHFGRVKPLAIPCSCTVLVSGFSRSLAGTNCAQHLLTHTRERGQPNMNETPQAVRLQTA